MPVKAAMRAASTWVAVSPAVIWRGVAPKARARALVRRVSMTVAQVTNRMLMAATVSRRAVRVAATWSTLWVLAPASTLPATFTPSVVVWRRARVATVVATAMVMLAMASTVLAGRRALVRTASRSGAGRRLDRAMSLWLRCGGRAGFARART